MSAVGDWLRSFRSSSSSTHRLPSPTPPTLHHDRYERLPDHGEHGLYYERTRTSRAFTSIDRDWIAFFTFGCINNLIYVVILSAAVDLVGANVPKGVVLLADIMPSLMIKSVAPYFIHRVPYPVRVVFCASLSFFAVVIIAFADTIPIRLVGVTMASFSSGFGELTFLMLSSFYRLQMVSAWSSGTGGAGLLGALLFLALTSWIGLSIRATLGVVSMFPIAMLVAYFVILTKPKTRISHPSGYRPILNSSSTGRLQSEEGISSPVRSTSSGSSSTVILAATASGAASPTSHHPSSAGPWEGVPTVPPPLTSPWHSAPTDRPIEPTSINTLLAATDPEDPSFVRPFRELEDGTGHGQNGGVRNGNGARGGRRYKVVESNEGEPLTLREKWGVVQTLFWPFMMPLFVVYAAEYTMNQGVLPVILYPLDQTPFSHMRDHYVTYSAIYQLGVFISRSSASFFQIRRVWIPSVLQCMTLALALSQALLGNILPSVYLMGCIVLWEGLLGGSTYVHTYLGLSQQLEHDPQAKEFALGAVGVADGLGITLAGVASLWIEPALCRYQVVERGVKLCLAMAD